MYEGMYEEINLEGFQVVKANTFTTCAIKSEPTCTLWPIKFSFNKTALTSLHNCENIRIEINTKDKKMLIVPVNAKDKDAIRWIRGQKNLSVRVLESHTFCEQLYNGWHLDRDKNYRASGRVVVSNTKLMLLFDFEKADTWVSKKPGANNG